MELACTLEVKDGRTSRSCDYSPEVPNCQECWISMCQIKGLLLYLCICTSLLSLLVSEIQNVLDNQTIAVNYV